MILNYMYICAILHNAGNMLIKLTLHSFQCTCGLELLEWDPLIPSSTCGMMGLRTTTRLDH